jgi:hypothetical protein
MDPPTEKLGDLFGMKFYTAVLKEILGDLILALFLNLNRNRKLASFCMLTLFCTFQIYDSYVRLEASQDSSAADTASSDPSKMAEGGKDGAQFEHVTDLVALRALLEDPIAKTKYQQQLNVFLVGYDFTCRQRLMLLNAVQHVSNEKKVEILKFVFTILKNDLRKKLAG